MPNNDQIKDQEKLEIIETLFQESINKLKEFHQEKLALIKKFRSESNLEELNKIRKSLQEQA